jgi:hypothetical protein
LSEIEELLPTGRGALAAEPVDPLQKLSEAPLELSTSDAEAAVIVGEFPDDPESALGNDAGAGGPTFQEGHAPHPVTVIAPGALALGFPAADLVLVERGWEEGGAGEEGLENGADLPVERRDFLA